MVQIIDIATRDDWLDMASDALASGKLVAVPTETVYGLAADAGNDRVVRQIFEAKGRPGFNPLICHVSDEAMARSYGNFDAHAGKLAAAFWPGPLTLVVPTGERRVADPVTAGLPTIALRQPRGIMAQLVARLERPLAAPSANRSGSLSPTSAQHVAESLGDAIDLILDGGPCPVGVESTIVKCADGRATLLREGGVPRDEIEAVIGALDVPDRAAPVEAPGMMLAHYAPRTPLRLNADAPQAGEVYLAFGSADGTTNLSASGDLDEAARNLFAMLWQLDREGAARIAVAPIPIEGIGAAINDRLQRAAAS